jgi:hypothetical protein
MARGCGWSGGIAGSSGTTSRSGDSVADIRHPAQPSFLGLRSRIQPPKVQRPAVSCRQPRFVSLHQHRAEFAGRYGWPVPFFMELRRLGPDSRAGWDRAIAHTPLARRWVTGTLEPWHRMTLVIRLSSQSGCGSRDLLLPIRRPSAARSASWLSPTSSARPRHIRRLGVSRTADDVDKRSNAATAPRTGLSGPRLRTYVRDESG